MPYLEQTVTEINNTLKATCLKDKRFFSSRFESVVSQAMVSKSDSNEVFIPLAWTSEGEYKEVVFDDAFPLTIYHRVLSNNYSFDANNEFGREKKKQRCTTTMLMCVMAFRNQIKISKEDLEAQIVVNFPLGNTPNFLLKPLQTNTLSIIDSNMDSLSVFQSEFKGLDVRLNQEKIIFSIRYKIESTYYTGCFDICSCQEN